MSAAEKDYMPVTRGPSSLDNQQVGPILEIDILWITAGLGCDGDTIAMTAATQPGIEDIVRGSLPWIPRVTLHNPVLDYENGDEFLKHWASFGTDTKTGQPITTCQWIDWLAPRAWAVVAVGTCATYGGIHAMEGNLTGCMGLPIISDGNGNRNQRFPSCASRAVRLSRTTSPKPCCIFCTWRRSGRP